MVCSHNGILPDNEKGHSTMTCNNVDESQNSMLHKRRLVPLSGSRTSTVKLEIELDDNKTQVSFQF